MTQPTALPAEALARRFDPQDFAFATTAELEDAEQFPQQQRVAHAIELGVGIDQEGYNLFVMGPSGSGRHDFARAALASHAAQAPHPSDWVYVNNFLHAHQPIAIALPPGQATALRDDMQHFVEELQGNIPAVFESDEYRSKVENIDAEFKERHDKAFAQLSEEATAQHVALLRTPAGFSFAPLKDNAVMAPEDFVQLSEADQRRIREIIEKLQTHLEAVIRDVMRWRKERAERIRDLNRTMTLLAVGHHVDELKQRYASLPKVVAYLDAVQLDVLDNADDFLKPGEDVPQMVQFAQKEGASLRRYQVNVLVGDGTPAGSPVVYADHPTLQNLVGRTDHVSRFGTLVTDFLLVKPGALHRANGGYLLIDALKLLTQPFAWDGLKRALLRRDIRVESPAEAYGLVSTVSLEPEPIPLRLKVILIGERELFYLLQAYDADFGHLFRITADFDDSVERTAASSSLFARLVATRARRDKLLPLDREAVARVLDFGSRIAGDTRKITANIQRLVKVLHEADHHARQAGSATIKADAVLAAIGAQRHRAARLHKQVQDAVLRGKILIDTQGTAVGQVNGLSVFELGGHRFGGPVRITATTRLGEGQVIDIQRETDLGGAIHSKGVMILSAFLAARFSSNLPHSLAASLVFEQTYGLVDGDSASLGELCALLSSLSGLPVRQYLAVTGSVNQLGDVQPIGAVNEKIEGFFDICNARGLMGQQGVLIPASNADELMLNDDVVAAVAEGKFHVYPVRSVDEAIELLTGVAAGADQRPEPGAVATVNSRVAARLRQLAALRRGLARPEKIVDRTRRPKNGR